MVAALHAWGAAPLAGPLAGPLLLLVVGLLLLLLRRLLLLVLMLVPWSAAVGLLLWRRLVLGLLLLLLLRWLWRQVLWRRLHRRLLRLLLLWRRPALLHGGHHLLDHVRDALLLALLALLQQTLHLADDLLLDVLLVAQHPGLQVGAGGF
jgi:hypothetical protein